MTISGFIQLNPLFYCFRIDIMVIAYTLFCFYKPLPAHIKSSLFGCDLTIPFTGGQLNLGTWQGIYLCEHRDQPHQRHLLLTLQI